MNQMNVLLRRSRLALQELGPSMALLNLPGGYLIALTGWLHRRWPLGVGLRNRHGGTEDFLKE